MKTTPSFPRAAAALTFAELLDEFEQATRSAALTGHRLFEARVLECRVELTIRDARTKLPVKAADAVLPRAADREVRV